MNSLFAALLSGFAATAENDFTCAQRPSATGQGDGALQRMPYVGHAQLCVCIPAQHTAFLVAEQRICRPRETRAVGIRHAIKTKRTDTNQSFAQFAG